MLMPPAFAASAPIHVTVRGGAHSDFDRIVFDWPRKVDYTIKRDGKQVTITFSTPAQFADGAVKTARLTRADGFAQAADNANSRYAFIAATAAKIAESRNGAALIFDITGPAAGPSPAAQLASPKPPEESKAANKAPAAVAPLMLAPLAALPPPPSLPVEPETQQAASVRQPDAPAPAPAPAPLTPVERNALIQSNASTTPLAASQIKLPAPGEPPLLVLQITPGMPLALAAYARGGYAYLILERKLAIDQKQLFPGQNTQLTLQPLNLPTATGFRFALPSGADLRVDRSGNTWLIYLAGEKRHVPVTLSLQAEPNYALGPRLLLPIVNPPEVIHFYDPVIGDELSILPLINPGDAMTTARDFADLTVLSSTQGLVVAHKSDKLAVRKVANGVEIAAEGGLRLSPVEDTGAAPRLDVGRASNHALMFDFNGWRGLAGEDFNRARQRLLQNIADVPPVERDRARLELARLYFAYGFGAEALALLNYVGFKLPDLYGRPEFRALHGASRILAGDADGGIADFSMNELNDVADRPLWEAFALAAKRDYEKAAPKFIATIGFIDEFPAALFARFATLALETMIATGQMQKADQWLDNWRTSKRHDDFLHTPAVYYLHGVTLYGAGAPDLAVKEWRYAAASTDRLYRTRAELALIDYDTSKGKLTAASAAQRLEGLRFAWRGDALEWDILRRLGQYYFDAKKFREGFANLERARKLYPDLPGNAELGRKMGDVFRDIFTTDLGAALPPLESLSLYQDYRYLITDETMARPIIRALSERLVAIDLLDQATHLLDDLQRDSTGTERAQTGARLAGIYLLDKQAEKSLNALAVSEVEGTPGNIALERQLLKARALMELGKTGEASALLANRNDQMALLLLADIAWRTNDWNAAAAALLKALGPPPAKDTPLTGDQISMAVRAATALALADNHAGLAKLAADFGGGMSKTPQNEIFTLLTHPQESRNIRDIAAMAMRTNDVDPFRKFLDRYRKAEEPGQKTGDGKQKKN
ncbi:MAG: hypothetical protein WDO70_07415 [Alphaproteobacteria bacterium]